MAINTGKEPAQLEDGLQDAAIDASTSPGEKSPPPGILDDFDGFDDSGNPQNWPMRTKLWHAIVPAIAAWLATLGSSIYTPGYREAALDFGVSNTAALVGLSVYAVGLAVGPAIAAPLSEEFGRKAVYVATLVLMSLFTLGAGFSNTLAAFLVTRFFAGACAGPVLAIGAGTMRDLFSQQHSAKASSLFIMAPFLGPVAGPIIGGFVVQFKDWRWSQWVVLMGAAVSLTCYVFTQETYKKTILDRRAKQRGLLRPNAMSAAERLKITMRITIFRPAVMMVTEAPVVALSIYTSFTFAVLFSFFAAFPLVFGEVYQFTTSQVGLTFIGLGTGLFAAVATNIITDVCIYQRLHRDLMTQGKGGNLAPEHRLYSAMFGSFGLPIGLFWFAWTARADVHWIAPVIASAIFGWGNLCVFVSSVLYLSDTYGALNGASAMAANGMMRYTLAAVFPLFIVQMYRALGIAWATSLLGFVSVALIPIPFVFFKFGPSIRKRSKYVGSAK